METKFLLFAIVSVVVIMSTIDSTEANLVLKSGGKKHKDIIVLGKKCEPTIIKSSGKKGKNGQTLIMNPDCHQDYKYQQKYELIPLPIMTQPQYHNSYQEYPMIHESYYHPEPQDYGYGYNSYGGGGGYGYTSGNNKYASGYDGYYRRR